MNVEQKRSYLFALEYAAFELENVRQIARERGRHRVADKIHDYIIDLDCLALAIKKEGNLRSEVKEVRQ